jgi:hypothetical protein
VPLLNKVWYLLSSHRLKAEKSNITLACGNGHCWRVETGRHSWEIIFSINSWLFRTASVCLSVYLSPATCFVFMMYVVWYRNGCRSEYSHNFIWLSNRRAYTLNHFHSLWLTIVDGSRVFLLKMKSLDFSKTLLISPVLQCMQTQKINICTFPHPRETSKLKCRWCFNLALVTRTSSRQLAIAGLVRLPNFRAESPKTRMENSLIIHNTLILRPYLIKGFVLEHGMGESVVLSNGSERIYLTHGPCYTCLINS